MELTGEFTVTIKLDGADMSTPDGLARVLHGIAFQLSDGDMFDNVRDVNGNTVGQWNINLGGTS